MKFNLNNLPAPLLRVRDYLAESPIAYRLARGAFWSLLGGVGARVLTAATGILIARLLGKDGYGEVGMVQSTLGMFGILAGFGLGSTATKYVAEFRDKDPQKAGRILTLTLLFSAAVGTVIALTLWIAADWLAANTLDNPGIAPLLRLGTLMLLLSAMSGVLSSALAGLESFRRIAIASIIQGLTVPVILLPCVWLYGTIGAIGGLVINSLVLLLVNAWFLHKECRRFGISLRNGTTWWQEKRCLWDFALPSLLSGLLYTPTVWITNTILVNQPGGYGELGLFNAANQWRMMVMYIPGLLGSVMLPILSETYGRENSRDFRNAIILNFKSVWLIALPLTVLVIVTSGYLAQLYGENYSGVEVIIPILIIATFLNVINGPVGSTLSGAGRMWIGAVINLGWSITMVMCTYIFVPRIGGVGLAVAYLIAYLFHSLWVIGYLEVKLARGLIIKEIRLIILSVVLVFSACILRGTDWLTVGAGLMVFVIALFPIVIAFRDQWTNYTSHVKGRMASE